MRSNCSSRWLGSFCDLFCRHLFYIYIYSHTSFPIVYCKVSRARSAPQGLTHAETVVDNQATSDVREALLRLRRCGHRCYTWSEVEWSYQSCASKLLYKRNVKAMTSWPIQRKHAQFDKRACCWWPTCLPADGLEHYSNSCVHYGADYHTMSLWHDKSLTMAKFSSDFKPRPVQDDRVRKDWK